MGTRRCGSFLLRAMIAKRESYWPALSPGSVVQQNSIDGAFLDTEVSPLVSLTR